MFAKRGRQTGSWVKGKRKVVWPAMSLFSSGPSFDVPSLLPPPIEHDVNIQLVV